jgi:hypothetical protein
MLPRVNCWSACRDTPALFTADGANYFLIFGPSLTATEQHALSSNPEHLSGEQIHSRGSTSSSEDDFGVGRRVCAQNWNALRAVGESANRRLYDAKAADAQPRS